MTYLLQTGTITGTHAGTNLHIRVQRLQGQPLPPSGKYTLLPPMRDPIFGYVVRMSSSQSSAGRNLANLFGTRVFEPATDMPKAERAPASSSASALGNSFVFCDRYIPGQNCLRISVGFADFIGALEASAGAAITVL